MSGRANVTSAYAVKFKNNSISKFSIHLFLSESFNLLLRDSLMMTIDIDAKLSVKYTCFCSQTTFITKDETFGGMMGSLDRFRGKLLFWELVSSRHFNQF